MAMFLILLTLVGAGILFSLWKGGVAERAGGAIVAANLVLALIINLAPGQLEGMLSFVNDGLTALALLVVTLRFGALWMGGVMLFYASQFALHSYYLVMNRPQSDYLHALINNINFTGIVWCLIIGTAVAWRRRLRTARARATAAAQDPAT